MAKSRWRLRTLILSGLVLGLMSFTTSIAHATPGAHWWIVDPLTGKLTELTATAIIFTDTPGTLLTKIAGVKVEFNCTTTESAGVQVEKEGSVSKSNGGGTLKFSGCTTKLNGVVSGACEPKAGGTEKGVITTKKLHALVVLHELSGGVKDHLVQILPVSGETFATIEMSELCSIGEKVPVIGKFFAKACDTLLEHLEKHLLEQGPLTELWAISKTAEHVATIDGSDWMLLTGAHKDFKFSGTTA